MSTGGNAPPIVVDAHAHVFAPLSDAYPRPVESHFPAEREATAASLRERMMRHGVTNAVLVAVSPHDRYVRESVRDHRGSFVAVGVHDEHTPDPKADLEQRTKHSGLSGLRLFRLGEPGTRDPRLLHLFPMLERMAELGMKLWLYPSPDQLPLVDRVAAALPDLPIVLNHLGFCVSGALTFDDEGLPHRVDNSAETLPAVVALSKHRNVHVLFSGQYAFSREAYPYADLAPVAAALYSAYGADRLLWASDYPWIVERLGYARLLDLPRLQLPDLDEREYEAIMGGTAAALFGLAEARADPAAAGSGGARA